MTDVLLCVGNSMMGDDGAGPLIAEMFMMTTHNMPLNYLIDQLKEDIGEVIFLGIQPDIVGFYYPMTQQIKDAVETVYQRLEGWEGNGGFAQLAAEEE